MKMLPVKFSEDQAVKIKNIVDIIGLDSSKVARAAMLLGTEAILKAIDKDKEKVKELVLVNDAKSK